MFEKPAEFPAPKLLEFPLSPEADRYYRYGPPFLQRFLPFWAASLLDRIKVMLLPSEAPFILPLHNLNLTEEISPTQPITDILRPAFDTTAVSLPASLPGPEGAFD